MGSQAQWSSQRPPSRRPPRPSAMQGRHYRSGAGPKAGALPQSGRAAPARHLRAFVGDALRRGAAAPHLGVVAREGHALRGVLAGPAVAAVALLPAGAMLRRPGTRHGRRCQPPASSRRARACIAGLHAAPRTLPHILSCCQSQMDNVLLTRAACCGSVAQHAAGPEGPHMGTARREPWTQWLASETEQSPPVLRAPRRSPRRMSSCALRAGSSPEPCVRRRREARLHNSRACAAAPLEQSRGGMSCQGGARQSPSQWHRPSALQAPCCEQLFRQAAERDTVRLYESL